MARIQPHAGAMIETRSFRSAIYSETEQNQRGPQVFKTGAFNHSATHPYEIAHVFPYRETINIRKRKTVYRGDPTGGDAA